MPALLGGTRAWRARADGPGAIAIVASVLIPLASWVTDGRGRFAFNMYASTVTYRLAITRVDGQGARRAIDPTEIAGRVSSAAAPFLSGAGVYRSVAQIDALRMHLRDVARAACREGLDMAVEVTLDERSPPGENGRGPAPGTARTIEQVACRPND